VQQAGSIYLSFAIQNIIFTENKSQPFTTIKGFFNSNSNAFFRALKPELQELWTLA
jgi:hypothetical protein